MKIRIKKYLEEMKEHHLIIIFFWVAVVSFYFAIWLDDGLRWFFNGALSLVLAILFYEDDKERV